MYYIINGGDGAGKNTQADLLLKKYPLAKTVREPGGTPEAEIIREVILSNQMTIEKRIKTVEELIENKNVIELCQFQLNATLKELKQNGLTGLAEAHLFAASRAQTNQTFVVPQLKDNQFLLGNRSVACSMSYQGYARGLGMDKVWEMNLPTLENAMPTLEIFIDLETDIAMERLTGRTEKSDRLDNEGREFHALTRKGYLEYYKNYCPYPYIIIDGNKSVEELHEDIIAIVKKQEEN